MMFFNIDQKSTIHLGNFVRFFYQELSRIAPSGHTSLQFQLCRFECKYLSNVWTMLFLDWIKSCFAWKQSGLG